MNFDIQIAQAKHGRFAEMLCEQYEISATSRGTGIARRKKEYILEKINKGMAIVAMADEDTLAGFCYIESWGHGEYVANSGLIVIPKFRKQGLAKIIKSKAFQLARDSFPEAKVFGITTSLTVMTINSDLGYRPVTFSKLTQDDAFWSGCKSCPNYDILQRNERKLCLCTGMLAPSKIEELEASKKKVTNYV